MIFLLIFLINLYFGLIIIIVFLGMFSEFDVVIELFLIFKVNVKLEIFVVVLIYLDLVLVELSVLVQVLVCIYEIMGIIFDLLVMVFIEGFNFFFLDKSYFGEYLSNEVSFSRLLLDRLVVLFFY